MTVEGGSKLDNKRLGNKFDRQLKEWGSSIPNILIGEFLLKNQESCMINKVDDFWKDKNMRDFCFEVVHDRNNGHKGIYDERKKELSVALEKYTTKIINEFKTREEQERKKGATNMVKFKKEREDIMGIIRAMEALKGGNKGKKITDALNKQETRDAKNLQNIKNLAGKGV